MFGAIAAIGLAASSSFDRVAPALGVTLGFVIVMYFLEILGSLWPAAAPLQPYSLFHYLKAKAILLGTPVFLDDGLLAAVIVAGSGVGAGRVPATRSRRAKLIEPHAHVGSAGFARDVVWNSATC